MYMKQEQKAFKIYPWKSIKALMRIRGIQKGDSYKKQVIKMVNMRSFSYQEWVL